MCGLLGLLTSGADARARTELFTDALRCSHHRGPDECATWSDDDVAVGINRLSIIDIHGSHQPLQYGPAGQPGRYTIVFNGEIYNYLELRAELTQQHGACFATAGDTEAVVAAYHH